MLSDQKTEKYLKSQLAQNSMSYNVQKSIIAHVYTLNHTNK